MTFKLFLIADLQISKGKNNSRRINDNISLPEQTL